LVSFPCLGFVFCAVGEGAGGRGISLSEKIWSLRLGVYFLTGDGTRCSSCGAFTKDSCDGMRANKVFCSTRVLAYPSFTFNHPSAIWRIFVAFV